MSGLCAGTPPHTSVHPGAAGTYCNYVNYAGWEASGQEGGAPFPSPQLFLFPGAVVSLNPRQSVGRSWDRKAWAEVPTYRAAKTTWFTGEVVTDTVAKAGQRDFLLDSMGSSQDWLLSDCESGKLMFGVLIHPLPVLSPLCCLY